MGGGGGIELLRWVAIWWGTGLTGGGAGRGGWGGGGGKSVDDAKDRLNNVSPLYMSDIFIPYNEIKILLIQCTDQQCRKAKIICIWAPRLETASLASQITFF